MTQQEVATAQMVSVERCLHHPIDAAAAAMVAAGALAAVMAARFVPAHLAAVVVTGIVLAAIVRAVVMACSAAHCALTAADARARVQSIGWTDTS